MNSDWVQTNYYAVYRQVYAPAFCEIDLLLKTMDAPLPLPEAARALRLPEAAVRRLMGECGVTTLDRPGFLAVMARGSGDLCRLYQREILRGGKPCYSPADIAYIYGLNDAHVQAVSEAMGHTQWPGPDVPALLENIPVTICQTK